MGSAFDDPDFCDIADKRWKPFKKQAPPTTVDVDVFIVFMAVAFLTCVFLAGFLYGLIG